VVAPSDGTATAVVSAAAAATAVMPSRAFVT
jgi:hypothetical protein